ncbi:hypothetical protein AAV99_12710 [Aurantiacibacter marinus]|uniref:N-acetyltransferase domain-containing protein n=1 Tax=Aurantiacibacter marinus TaxID=874156 RepID=A0A0H0XM51_9SPHN|nr:hypothetical protein AAV99_12710 [Aurantiacibacter marinus]
MCTSTTVGVPITITPARREDRALLEAFFERVSPQDLYYRFLTGMKKVDKQRIDAMVRDDDDLSIDFLALDSKTEEILATAILVAENDFETAEFAMCTRDDAKGKGISWALLDHAARYAEAMGVKRIYSLQSAAHSDALQLEQEMGFKVRPSPDDPALKLVEKTF